MLRLIWAITLAAFCAVLVQTPVLRASQETKTAEKKPKVEAVKPPSEQDIADAKSKSLVWVNTSTKVFHKPETATYGKTKHGKFMTEDEAVKAGYRAAKEPQPKGTKTTKAKQ